MIIWTASVLMLLWNGSGKSSANFWPWSFGRLMLIIGITVGVGALYRAVSARLENSRFARETCKTIDDLLPGVMAPLKVEAQTGGPVVWTKENVEAKVRAIIAQIADLPINQVTREKKLLADLGLE